MFLFKRVGGKTLRIVSTCIILIIGLVMLLHFGFHFPERWMKSILQKEFSGDRAFTNLVVETEYNDKYGVCLRITGSVNAWTDVTKLQERCKEIKKYHIAGRFTTTLFRINVQEAPTKNSKYDWVKPEKDGTYFYAFNIHASNTESSKDENNTPNKK